MCIRDRYSLDADTKGFNARAIIEEILEGVSARDARCVRLLYGYYDCENLVNFRKGRTAHNPLGNLSREEIEAVSYTHLDVYKRQMRSIIGGRF